MKNRDRLILVHHCRGIGWKTLKRLLDFDHDLSDVHHMSVSDFCYHLHMNRQHAEAFFHDLHHIDIQATLTSYEKNNIFTVTLHDDTYPLLLKTIYDPPWVLYGKGDPSLLQHQKIISVVGSRQPTSKAKQIMERLLMPLITDQWTIVSGMALGIDGYAHQLGLESSTIAVLGSGLYHPYPKQHRQLFDQMTTNHLVISEYPPNTPPQKWQFPERNRIISGLSLGTVVVEARERSGSLITADQALDQGRDVFAVPGSILETNACGTNRLIQQGAKLVMNTEDILNELSVHRIS